jgi:ferredoxin-thioredoxin reductase catalytic chain
VSADGKMVTDESVEDLRRALDAEAEASGYHLNPDSDFTRELVKGLLVNEARFGYRSCPCRLASGERASDADIVCPCDYRDRDLDDWGACYCALYVSKEILEGKREAAPVPERRPPAGVRKTAGETRAVGGVPSGSVPVWRCRVCGYLCARENPPESCPICKADRDRFELFWERE